MLPGNLLAGVAQHNALHYLFLAFTETVPKWGITAGRRRRLRQQILKQRLRHCRMHIDFVPSDGPDGRQQFSIGRLLEHVTSRAQSKSLAHIGRILVHSENEHVRLRGGLFQPGEHCQAIYIWHPQIQQDDVWLQGSGLFNRFTPIARLTDDLHVGLGAQQHPQPCPQYGMVIGEQDAERGG